MRPDWLDLALFVFWGVVVTLLVIHDAAIGWIIFGAFAAGERWNHAWR